jgi:hypothetical protein
LLAPRADDASVEPIGSAVRRELEQIEAEAGIELAADPSPPSGDLKSDIESFTTLDACVRARATVDPLLGDAIEALGYDTLTRDACRVLQALKAKNTEGCKPIASSALRNRCEAYVAVLSRDPSLCPVTGTAASVGARDPVCLARASRDERLCAAALLPERTKCRALVLGRAAECGRDDSCVRQVERFKSLLEKPETHSPLMTHLHVEIGAEKGSPEPVTKSLDLDEVASAGAVLYVGSEKVRLLLGAPKNAAWPAPDAPFASPRMFVELALPATAVPGSAASPSRAMKKGSAPTAPSIDLRATDLRLDLLVPKVAVLSAVMAMDTSVEVEELSLEPGGPIRFVLASTLRDTPRVFRVKIDVETFVRERSSRSENPKP